MLLPRFRGLPTSAKRSKTASAGRLQKSPPLGNEEVDSPFTQKCHVLQTRRPTGRDGSTLTRAGLAVKRERDAPGSLRHGSPTKLDEHAVGLGAAVAGKLPQRADLFGHDTPHVNQLLAAIRNSAGWQSGDTSPSSPSPPQRVLQRLPSDRYPGKSRPCS
jgi:hypothetical protein